MYGNKLVIVLCVVGVVWAGNNTEPIDDLKVIDSIRPELPCLSKGGMCTIKTDCPDEKLVNETKLCPEQEKIGVECCYAVSLKETRCQKRGGVCMESCTKNLETLATDCPAKTKCCLLAE
ncbi:hypothetical protein PYW08_014376 [Mythimna loreyi]|uniref:Uncharacterized protein n=1 Tax=Mythimna loreyi TaxID=667449 RepID=A0ACC2R9F8_9NEOP|nr:hypothetical protein PYW08_014376 [Mythimna loreyi]